VHERAEWDVAIVGGGPAGLAAAHAAAVAGARTVILERAEHPRYKTCGGGLLGASLDAIPDLADVPARDVITRATFTLRGGSEFTRSARQPVITMVMRDDFDSALLDRALAAGATVRQRSAVRAIDSGERHATVRLGDGSAVTAAVVIGADGSAGMTARHVGVTFEQVDLGLELEIAVPPSVQRAWAGRILLDWGQIPGSYGWVFPKGDRLTVGVIAARDAAPAPRPGGGGPAAAVPRGRQAEATRAYLREFVARLGLAGFGAVRDSGHLTRCRRDDSPLRAGRVIVAGDAAGLLEPFTREGISYALRSGALAGQIAAKAVSADEPAALDEYAPAVDQGLGAEMRASRMLLMAYTRHAGAYHLALATRPGWRMFAGVCRGEMTHPELVRKPAIRLILSVLNRLLLCAHNKACLVDGASLVRVSCASWGSS
jgi:geranylgeranyl reductase family protein